MSNMLYLDHAATTPLRPEARDAMMPFLGDAFGNPSGIHGISRHAKNAMEQAREEVAELLGAARPLEVVFTGGGSESDNLAVKGAALAGGARRGVVTTAIEHEAVLGSAGFVADMGSRVDIVSVGRDCVVDPAAVAASVTGATAVVSVMLANNETGTLQPLRKAVDEVRAANSEVLVHTDAVQAFLSEEVSTSATGADLISLSAHKLGGPKGVGLLWVREGVELEPTIHGGGQELGRRSGTHNVAGIVAMAEAMKVAAVERDAFRTRVGAERDLFEQRMGTFFPDLVVTAAGGERLVQTSHFRVPGAKAETLLVRLDQAGLSASAGSACHSGAVEVSHVLSAMGVDDGAAAEYLRFSFGWTTREGDGERAADIVRAAVEGLE